MNNEKSTDIFLGRQICSGLYLITVRLAKDDDPASYPDLPIYKQFESTDFPDIGTNKVVDIDSRVVYQTDELVNLLSRNKMSEILAAGSTIDDPDARHEFLNQKLFKQFNKLFGE